MDLQNVIVGLLALFALTEASLYGMLPGNNFPGANLASNSLGKVKNLGSSLGQLPGADLVSNSLDNVKDLGRSLGQLPGADLVSNSLDNVKDLGSSLGQLPGADLVSDSLGKVKDLGSSLGQLPGADLVSNSLDNVKDLGSSLGQLPGADLASQSLGTVKNLGSSLGVPGVGDMMSMASGGLESMVKMMLKMIDMSMITKVIQKISAVVKTALDSGLQKLDAKMDKELGIKEFSTGTITLAHEAEVPQYIIDALMGFTSIASQALLFAE